MSLDGLPTEYKDLSSALQSAESVQTAECPPVQIWFEVAAGTDTAGKLLDHATGCRFCSVVLRHAIEDLHAETSPVERELLQAALAVPKPASPVAFPITRPRWVWAVAAGLAAAAIIGTWTLVRPVFALNRANAYLAKAEQSFRFSQYRMSDAPQIRHMEIRGDAGESLPDAALRAKDDLENARDWGRVAGNNTEARLALARIALAGAEAAEVADIEEAISRNGATPAMLNDLGIALAQASKSHPELSDQVIEKFREAGMYAPALYNRAVFLHGRREISESCQVETLFLSVETDPRWRSDLQDALDCGK